MYCKKLQDTLSSDIAIDKGIDQVLINKLDYYIKFHTTSSGRKNINPISFAIKMGIDDKLALFLFKAGTKMDLFEVVLVFLDPLGEQHKISNINDTVINDFGNEFRPEEYKDRVRLYFKLLDSPEDCEESTNEDSYPIDAFLEGDDEKKSLVISEVEGLIGEKDTNELIVHKKWLEIVEEYNNGND